MSPVTGSWVMDSLLLIATLLYLIYWYLTCNYRYFESRGIPYIKPSLLVGYSGLFTKSQMEQAIDLYNSLPDERFFGYFQLKEPVLVIKDPELVQRVMVKDFVHFHDRGFYFGKNDILSKTLFSRNGQTWRSLRNKLTPTFSSGKLKLMFDQLLTCGDHMLKSIKNSSLCEAKLLSSDFAIEVLASIAFGLNFSKDNPQTQEFLSRVGGGFTPTSRQKVFQLILAVTPWLADLLGVSFTAKESTAFFLDLIKATKQYRKKNNIDRNDYFQQLLKLQENDGSGEGTSPTPDNDEDTVINQMQYAPESLQAKVAIKLTDEDITAQTLGFLMGGSDSVASTISCTLYHIAKEPGIQGQVTRELDAVLAKHGGWTYQAIKEMTYLEQVIQETGRLYPIVPLNLRQCTLSYRIPNSDVVVEAGTRIVIPVAGLHMDPKLYPSPKQFNPDRFAENNFKPSPFYMPFGDGPRICIAMRFAVLEMKVCLAKILSQYSIHVNQKTQEPFTFHKNDFSPDPVGGIWIDFKERSQCAN